MIWPGRTGRAASPHPAPLAGTLALRDAGRWRRQQHAGRRWAAWGLALGAVLGAATQAPAQWLAEALQQATAGRLLLAQAEGSVWQGSAVPVLTGGPGSRDAAALPGRLHWQLRPGWRGLQLSARHDCCLNGTLQARLAPGWSGWTVTLDGRADGQPLGRWPATWLAGLGTPWNTLQLGGLLQLSTAGLTLQSAQGRLQVAGTLALELHDTQSRLSPLPVLGSYRLSLEGGSAGTPPGAAPGQPPAPPTPPQALLRLETLDGRQPSALRLNGSGHWSGARLRFRGQAEAAPGQDGPLANLLNIIGRRQGALSVISIG
ncbi:type II secretion system protein N [Aquabacterium sp. OR-4]|uniref:type II secretion system protein N n=1 Tax=Aquabacterium sp. OR-4 TaxID=2978127 RepID=UPI0021B2E628|nr:type II secretion system protein N [Aquabacterium sp. OR-4]MDT7837598.1 type II secretion system protein N [Aquabacterium sp. OR-4]